jgi:hypothetical protein
MHDRVPPAGCPDLRVDTGPAWWHYSRKDRRLVARRIRHAVTVRDVCRDTAMRQLEPPRQAFRYQGEHSRGFTG